MEKHERRRRGDVDRGDNDDDTRSTYSRMSKGTTRTAATGKTGATDRTNRTGNSLSVVKANPYVSDRVAQALAERRMAQSREKVQNIRGLLGNLSMGQRNSYEDQEYSPQRTSRGGGNNRREEDRIATLNSARLREHDRLTRRNKCEEEEEEEYYASESKQESLGNMTRRERGDKNSPNQYRSSPSGGGGYERSSPARSTYNQSRYDGRSEMGHESVADSVISRAMSRKGSARR
jgi:hypothetical protein